MDSPLTMRKACSCGSITGRIETRGGQDCVFCIRCGRFQYNAPKTETGREVRTVTTVHNGIKPKQRARVLQAANGRCELCGKSADEATLHVGHIISVDEGMKAGFSDQEINDDDNLLSLCDECNLGIGSEPIVLRFAIRVYSARLKFRKTTCESV
jgi:hypothetical protein